MDKRLARLAVYAYESYSADTGSAANIELRQKVELLDSKVNEASAFVNPEVLRLGGDRVARFIAEDKALAIYRHPLDRILRAAPHTLDDQGEAIIAQFGLAQGAGESAYSILTNADIPWPTVKLSTGEEVKLDASAYTRYREVPDRDDRKRVMDAFFGTFKTYEQTLGTTLYSQLKEDAVLAKVRKYPDSITRALNRNRIPIAVMDTLIAQTNANLSTLHRYFPPEEAVRRPHGWSRLRSSPLHPGQLLRQLRVGHDRRARVGTCDAHLARRPRAAVRDFRLSDLHRRDRLYVQRGAAAAARAERRENR
jgi:oligoendopeptidase F